MFYRNLYIVFLFFSTACFSQVESLGDVRVVTGNENSYAVLVNSNGWGLNYRYGKRLDGFRKRIYDIDFVYLKHPKEIKTQNPYYENQKRFVFGKLNTLYALRGGIGIQKEIYSKFDKGGVAVKFFYEGGITLGALKPVYYVVVDSMGIKPNDPYTSDKKFDYSIHSVEDIYSRSSFFKGLGETKIKPALFIKLGLSFVYSNAYDVLNALEAGVIVDGFYQDVPIMANQKNEQIFVSLFISYRFGKVGVRNKSKFNSNE